MLVNANLDGADLRRADLSQADLRGASLAGVQVDERTLHEDAIFTEGTGLHQSATLHPGFSPS